VALLLASILAVWQFLAPTVQYFRVVDDAAKLRTQLEFLTRHAREGTPVAVADPLSYLQLAHHASPAWGAGLVYVNSPEESLRYLGKDTSERALRVLRDRANLPIIDLETFLGHTPEFLVFGEGWLLSALEAREAHRIVTVLDTCQGTRLTLVRAKDHFQ
jgi:hypothetical protein